jgi:hypothetical protein
MNLSRLSHSLLEVVAEDAEDFLNNLSVPLMSHSYENIIQQAVSLGFTSPVLSDFYD